jgi:Na+-transporting NADH:ubiquinone oxidoreductase subunit C
MEPLLGLIKGKVNPDAANAAHQIDGLSGATLTSDGVSRMVKFWMGENGYAPFLTNLKAGGV